MQTIRVRLVFDKSLIKHEGDEEYCDMMRKCWYLIPNNAVQVSDLLHDLLHSFSYMLDEDVKLLTLTMHGFILPPHQLVKGLIRDDDEIRVKKALKGKKKQPRQDVTESIPQEDTNAVSIANKTNEYSNDTMAQEEASKNISTALSLPSNDQVKEPPTKKRRRSRRSKESIDSETQQHVIDETFQDVPSPSVNKPEQAPPPPIRPEKAAPKSKSTHNALARSWGFSNWDKKEWPSANVQPTRRINPLASSSSPLSVQKAPALSPSVEQEQKSTYAKSNDYSRLKPLNRDPRPGDVIVYKTLVMDSDSLTPQISSYIEAKVLDVQASSNKRAILTLFHSESHDEEGEQISQTSLSALKNVLLLREEDVTEEEQQYLLS